LKALRHSVGQASATFARPCAGELERTLCKSLFVSFAWPMTSGLRPHHLSPLFHRSPRLAGLNLAGLSRAETRSHLNQKGQKLPLLHRSQARAEPRPSLLLVPLYQYQRLRSRRHRRPSRSICRTDF
jgi:hypothetical protein